MKGKFLYVTAAVLSLAVISTAVIAKRANEVEYTYLNSKGQVVGGKTYFCGGGISQWGTVTSKYQTYSTPCGDF